MTLITYRGSSSGKCRFSDRIEFRHVGLFFSCVMWRIISKCLNIKQGGPQIYSGGNLLFYRHHQQCQSNWNNVCLSVKMSRWINGIDISFDLFMASRPTSQLGAPPQKASRISVTVRVSKIIPGCGPHCDEAKKNLWYHNCPADS